jgi:hypothetical protein
MESAIFRKWLTERGCRFDRHEHEKRGEGQVIVTVHREGRKTEVPLGGSHQILDARVVRQACEGSALIGRNSQGRRVASEVTKCRNGRGHPEGREPTPGHPLSTEAISNG